MLNNAKPNGIPLHTKISLLHIAHILVLMNLMMVKERPTHVVLINVYKDIL
jgi:hypothetical protein